MRQKLTQNRNLMLKFFLLYINTKQLKSLLNEYFDHVESIISKNILDGFNGSLNTRDLTPTGHYTALPLTNIQN